MHTESLSTEQRLIPHPELCRSLGMSRSGIDKLKKQDPSFPRPIKFGASRQAASYYVASEVEQWLQSKMDERGAA